MLQNTGDIIPKYPQSKDKLQASYLGSMVDAINKAAVVDQSPTATLRLWARALPAHNSSGRDIPAYSAVEVQGITGSNLMSYVKRPTSAGLDNVAFSQIPIPHGRSGTVFFGGIHVVRVTAGTEHSTADTYWPVTGGYCTTERDSFRLVGCAAGQWMIRGVTNSISWLTGAGPPPGYYAIVEHCGYQGGLIVTTKDQS